MTDEEKTFQKMTNQLWEFHYQMWMVIGFIAERLFVELR